VVVFVALVLRAEVWPYFSAAFAHVGIRQLTAQLRALKLFYIVSEIL
jgi:hypothetical protein